MILIYILVVFITSQNINYQWKYLSGNITDTQVGIYGTINVFDSLNIPGSRFGHIGKALNDEIIFIFGGRGFDNLTQFQYLNDLWLFNTTSLQWKYISGDTTGNQIGIYGTINTYSSSNKISGRNGHIGDILNDEIIFTQGGFGYDSESSPRWLNDLWFFNVTSLLWKWVSGNDTGNKLGIYGTLNVYDSINVPGSRVEHVGGKLDENTIFIHGGGGYDSISSGTLNDLWFFNTSSLQWKWMSGNYTGDENGIYGIKNQFNISNIPGSRANHIGFRLNQYSIIIHGGVGFDSEASAATIFLNDVWLFNSTISQWKYVSGDITGNKVSIFGNKFIYHSSNIPAGRRGHTGSLINNTLMFIQGGELPLAIDLLNDLWFFNLITFQWKWISGDTIGDQLGIYGTKNVYNSSNKIGSRNGHISGVLFNDTLFFHGGAGYHSISAASTLSDLWYFAYPLYTCFGINSIESYVCFGHGECTNFDTCVCEDTWIGEDCFIHNITIPTCFNISSQTQQVCSGNGFCLSDNICTCNDFYQGNECETRITTLTIQLNSGHYDIGLFSVGTFFTFFIIIVVFVLIILIVIYIS
jgi:hypothetical protein